MAYIQALEGLYARGHELTQPGSVAADSQRRKFNLEQMRALAAALGNPQQRFRSVLIAGTNGKGSTAAMLANIAQTAHYRVGLYTSPHLSRVNERVQINGIPISDDDFERLYFQVDAASARLLGEHKLPQPASFFEVMTAIAFLSFAEQRIDLAVLEVGIGGRLDATNIVEPLLSIITDISLDHMEWLGNTIDAIAREKAGILRRNGVLVTLPQHPEANQALGEVATALEVKGVNAAAYMPAFHASPEAGAWNSAYDVEIQGKIVELTPPLAGSHQHRNIALAIAAACELSNSNSYNISADDIAQGICGTRWAGRLELFPRTESRCTVLLDVAHNPAGIWSLRSALNNYASFGPRTLLFGCLRDKAFREMVQVLFPVFDQVVLTPVDSPRTVAAQDLLDVAKSLGVKASIANSPQSGLDEAVRLTPADGLLVCAGSVYLVGPVRDRLVDSKIEACR